MYIIAVAPPRETYVAAFDSTRTSLPSVELSPMEHGFRRSVYVNTKMLGSIIDLPTVRCAFYVGRESLAGINIEVWNWHALVAFDLEYRLVNPKLFISSQFPS